MSAGGVADLARDLRELQERFGLDAATASRRLAGEVVLTLALRRSGGRVLLTIEREHDGEVVTLQPQEVGL
jgi:hypothetical protein